MNSTISVVTIGALVAALVAAAGAFVFIRLIRAILRDDLARYVDGMVGDIRSDLRTLNEEVEALPRKWSEIKRESDRLRQRALYHSRRAIEELESNGYRDPELEQIQIDLGEDGGGGSEDGVQPVHSGVEVDQSPEQDWMAQALAKKYGRT